jgi:hypothetical protein
MGVVGNAGFIGVFQELWEGAQLLQRGFPQLVIFHSPGVVHSLGSAGLVFTARSFSASR